MNISTKTKLAMALAIQLPLLASGIHAAVLEEVMVTAQKREQSAQDVGISITAYTGEQMEQLGFTNAQQVTAMAPGVHTVQPNGEANYAIGIRGVASSDFTTNVESPVALYIDEVYISQMSGAGFALFDMERVEILRGPQGTLFGRNATGGLIHYITKKPTEGMEGYVKGTIGDYDQYKVEGAVGGGSDKVAVRLSGSYNRADGYITNRLDPGTDLNNADDTSYRLQVLFTPSEDIEFLFNARGADQDIDTGFFENVSSIRAGELTPNEFNPVLGYIDNDGDVFAGDYDDPGYNDLETRGYTGTLKWSFDNFTLTSITDFSTVERKYIEDSDASPAPVFNFFLNTDAEQFSQEIRLDGETDSFKWVAGFYYMDLDIQDSNGAITDPFIGPVYDEIGIPRTPGSEAGLNNPYRSELESMSVFGQLEFALSDSVNLIVGGRYIDDEKDFSYSINAVEFVDPEAKDFDASGNLAQMIELAAYAGDRSDKEWSARAQLDWSMSEDTMLYTSWNRGVRGGGYNAPIFPLSPPLGYDDPTMTYDPEQLDAYEFGFKGSYLDGKMRMNGAVYYYDYADYQAFYITGIDTITFNTDADSIGGELEIQASPTEGLDILLGFAYNDVDVDLPGGDGPSIQSPKLNMNALIRYEWPAFGGSIAIQGDVVYRDEVRFALIDAETLTQDGYAVSNASVTYTTDDGKWQASAYVHNLTDKEYKVQTFDLSGMDVFGMTEQYYGRPRWWGVSLAYRWGE
ncbi:MAG: TonB-dependent receptor [Halieaceae bacterium]|nr:TonB-dependent receptor [Halieaceae bacterium]